MLSRQDIQNRFRQHPSSEGGRGRLEELSYCFEGLAKALEELLPEGREKALVFTKLEEAGMWAAAAVNRNEVTR